MNKPLKDWTLGEVKDYCRKRNCDGRDSECRFDQFCERITDGWYSPEEWDLTEKPRFTPKEVERAMAIKLLLPDANEIYRAHWFTRVMRDGADIQIIKADLFPSLYEGQTVKVSDIIGG